VTYDRYNTHVDGEDRHSRKIINGCKLRATDLYEHWLAEPDQVERMIAYVNRCPIIGGQRLALLMFDVDCHHGQDQQAAQTTVEMLSNLFDLPIYWEISTSGSGRHGYGLFGWSASTSYWQIISDIDLLQSKISSLTASLPAPCNEVRGAPLLLEGRFILGGSSWAKVPRPQTKDDAEALLNCLNRSEAMADALKLAEVACSSNPSTVGAMLNGMGSTAPAKSKREGGKTVDSTASRDTLKTLFDTHDTFHRCVTFIHRYRPLNPTWTESEAWTIYTSHGLDIGNSDDRCFKAAWKRSEKTWDPNFYGKPGLEKQAKANEAFIERVIVSGGTLACLTSDHARRERIRKYRVPHLTIEMLAQVFTLVTNSLREQSGGGTIGKKQICTGLDEIYGGSMNGQMFKTAMRWLRRNKLIEKVGSEIPPWRARGAGRARLYRFGPAHPEAIQTVANDRVSAVTGSELETAQDRFQPHSNDDAGAGAARRKEISMTSMYNSASDPEREDDLRRAEAIAKLSSFAPKLYEIERLRKYVIRFQSPNGGGDDYEAPAERLRRLREQQTGRKMPMYHYDALFEMTGELLRRTSQHLSTPELQRLAREIEAEVKESRREFGNEQRAKSLNGVGEGSGPMEVEF
jgi:hypothetical protein